MENYFQALIGLIFFPRFVWYVSPKFNSWRGRKNALMSQGFLSTACCHTLVSWQGTGSQGPTPPGPSHLCLEQWRKKISFSWWWKGQGQWRGAKEKLEPREFVVGHVLHGNSSSRNSSQWVQQDWAALSRTGQKSRHRSGLCCTASASENTTDLLGLQVPAGLKSLYLHQHFTLLLGSLRH